MKLLLIILSFLLLSSPLFGQSTETYYVSVEGSKEFNLNLFSQIPNSLISLYFKPVKHIPPGENRFQGSCTQIYSRCLMGGSVHQNITVPPRAGKGNSLSYASSPAGSVTESEFSTTWFTGCHGRGVNTMAGTISSSPAKEFNDMVHWIEKAEAISPITNAPRDIPAPMQTLSRPNIRPRIS